ncbi:hypothetical protein PPACK8108_LOCUS9711 [Phakopsora pachyrhizi]|uniref:Uncharacterized protein n=1 Tax=Phakopsora pachyrhizi TaxID=170000 RepID=A0AAV0B0G4_PHAPC|nr:hypothetical protein PPACK8108_LOCUS9711 [Phakopsora pachyrhizi]
METQKNEKNIEKLDKLRNEFVAAQSSLSEIKMSERNAIENLEKKDEENLRTIAENAQLKVQKINLEQRVSILQEDLDKLHQVHEDSIRSFHDQKYFASRFQTLQSELNALQINHHALKEEHKKVLKLKTDLQVKNKMLMLEVEKSLSHQEALEIKVKDYNHEIASQKNLIEKLKYQGSEFEANTRDLSSKLSQAQHDFASAEKEMFSIEKEAARLRLFEVQCKELEEKVARLLEAQYKDEKNRKDLQERLDFNQERWEDLKSREDLAMGQVTVLQEKLTEAKDNQTSMVCLSYLLRLGLKEQLADLKAQNNELKEVIEELNVRLREELSLRNKLEDKIQNFEQDILSIKKAAQDEANEKEKFFLEEKHQIKKDLASKESEVKLRKERESLTKSEIEELRRGLKLEEEKNVDLGFQNQRRVYKRVSERPWKSNAIATVEKKYEVKTGKKLSETESRLLAMSAELAKAREEIFSSSDQTELPSHGAGSNGI